MSDAEPNPIDDREKVETLTREIIDAAGIAASLFYGETLTTRETFALAAGLAEVLVDRGVIK